MKIIEHLLKAVRSAAVYNPEVQVAPACILWPDRDRQWEAVISRLQAELPELLILGDYASDKRTGPAIWLRCVMAGQTAEVSLPRERTPIFYLPGVSRQDLRAVENCPDPLKPLAELQYRGVIWSQVNAKDWTILAFLKSDQGGLGLDAAQDSDARTAMTLALHRLLDEEVERLRGKRLDKDYFNTLLTGGDPIRDLLQWLDQGEAFQSGRGASEWQAFVAVCQSRLAFNPAKEGVLAGAARLAARAGPWRGVWERYTEAPQRYPNIPGRIRQCPPPPFDLFADAESAGGWPQWNDGQEQALRRELMALATLPAHEASKRIAELARSHAHRRELVWAELGEAPLAMAMEPLGVLAAVTRTGLNAGTVADLQAGYASQGWRADDAALAALAEVHKPADLAAVTTAIRAVYLPWLEDSARYLQQLVDGASYPGGTMAAVKPGPTRVGECVLFVDGLRFDAARRLVDLLKARGCGVEERMHWAALPSVTATGKAAVSPVREMISGADDSDDFEPGVAATGQSLKGGYHFYKLLKDAGWKVLARTDNGDGQGNAWCEFGNIDKEGHDRGWTLARQLNPLLGEVAERVTALLAAGWKSVRIVTDHGWLLMPGKLPTLELASELTETQWGRCAAIKPGASTGERLYPWFWNPHQQFALADGVSGYRQAREYAHGGLSLQECLTLELTVISTGATAGLPQAEFTDIAWRGLRCTVAVASQYHGLALDIRTEPGNASSSVVVSVKPLKDNGVASVVVENEDLAGRQAVLVLLTIQGDLVAEARTVIGGG